MDIVKLAYKIYTLLKNDLLTDEDKVSQLKEGFKLINKEILLNILTYSHKNISEVSSVFSQAQFIQLKSLLFKVPFVSVLSEKIDIDSFIYTDKMYFNLLSNEDIEYYLNKDKNFLNHKINNSEGSVIKYLFVSNKYTSFDKIMNLFNDKQNLISSENKKEVGDYLKDNKEFLIKNYKNNIFAFLLLPEETFQSIFMEVKGQKENYLSQYIDLYKMESMLEKFLNNERCDKDRFDGMFVLNLFIDNNISINQKNLRHLLSYIDESKLPNLLDFKNFNYLAINPGVFNELKTKYKAFGNKEQQSEFVEKILKQDFMKNNITGATLFFTDIPDEYMISKKMKEMKMILRLLGKDFSKENVSILVKNITEITLNELEVSPLLKDTRLMTSLVKQLSYVSENDVTVRLKYFFSQFEQRSLLDAMIKQSDKNVFVKSKRL